MIIKTVIVGCGNGLSGDDAAGLAVADLLRAQVLPAGVELVTAGMPGVALLDILAGYDRAVIVDGVVSGGEAGNVLMCGPDALAEVRAITSLHGFSVAEALALGKVLQPERMPEQIKFVGIEIDPAHLSPGSVMSVAVKAAVEQAARLIVELIVTERL